jgi:hypothetical protein
VSVVVSVVVAGFFVVVVSSVVVVFVCAKANGATSAQIKPMIVLFTLPSLLMVSIYPQVRGSWAERTLRVPLIFASVFKSALFDVFASSVIERARPIH